MFLYRYTYFWRAIEQNKLENNKVYFPYYRPSSLILLLWAAMALILSNHSNELRNSSQKRKITFERTTSFDGRLNNICSLLPTFLLTWNWRRDKNEGKIWTNTSRSGDSFFRRSSTFLWNLFIFQAMRNNFSNCFELNEPFKVQSEFKRCFSF